MAERSVAGVVLAYNPEPEIVENVRLIGLQTAAVYVVDNTPAGATDPEVVAALTGIPGVRILALGENRGVAAGFNEGMRAALADGHDDVWIFDQDSTVTEGMLDRMLAARAASRLPVGIAGPALRSHATGVVYRAETGTSARPVGMLISSGSLFSKETIERIGLHDEPLFIDYVDHDISLRARRYGLVNLKVYDALLDHRFGDSEVAHVLGRRVYLSNYSEMRQYHMARNRIIVLKRFGPGRWFWDDAVFTAKAWIKVLLREENRRGKIRAFLRGTRDGWRYPTR